MKIFFDRFRLVLQIWTWQPWKWKQQYDRQLICLTWGQAWEVACILYPNKGSSDFEEC